MKKRTANLSVRGATPSMAPNKKLTVALPGKMVSAHQSLGPRNVAIAAKRGRSAGFSSNAHTTMAKSKMMKAARKMAKSGY